VLPPGIAIRHATGTDAPAILDLLAHGFESYRSFAPPGWEPPLPDDVAGYVLERQLARPEVWYVVAEDDRGHAGQCGFNPGHEQRNMQGARIPGLAHLWQLFVREDRWGGGLAGELHDRAVAAMRERGYERARLGTPLAHARARRFYERRGWRAAPMSMEAPEHLGLELVEYRLEL
jgi:GNAT superfamily N-acetyltransferase